MELSELDCLLDHIMITAEDEVYVIDLHSTSADGQPFATVGDTLRNRAFAERLPVRMLLGVEEQLDGTMLEHLNNLGAVTLGFEGGRHDAPSTVHNHSAMIWLALAAAGILSPADIPDFSLHVGRLSADSAAGRFMEVRYREPVREGDDFVMTPGFNNFDPVRRGQPLARNRAGEILAPETGLILMPLYQKLGEDGFFIVRRVAPFWLWLSGVLRRFGLADLVHLLPGVARDPDAPEKLIVDTAIARIMPLQVFHLLGFRKLRWVGSNLIVTRRRHDTRSPFRRNQNGR
jgi:succinylglutamate desuccinylase